MKQALSLAEVVANTLSHMQAFLDQLDGERYKKSLDIFSHSSIGQHTRHVIEFFQCLIEQAPEGCINYEKRKRNVLIEENPLHASQTIDEIVQVLRSGDLAEELELESCYGLGVDHVFRVPTTLDRELIYNIEHAIHHLAMIRMGLKEVAPDLELPQGFGIAPSTLKHRKQIKQES